MPAFSERGGQWRSDERVAERVKRMVAVMALVGAIASPPSALGDDEKVDVQVMVIRATKSNKEVSSELKPIADALKEQFNFTGYKLLKRDGRGIEVGKAASFALTGLYTARITPKASDDRQVTLQIVVTEKKGDKETEKSNVTVKVTKGRFTLQGGLDLDGGDKLILAVAGK